MTIPRVPFCPGAENRWMDKKGQKTALKRQNSAQTLPKRKNGISSNKDNGFLHFGPRAGKASGRAPAEGDLFGQIILP